MKKKVTFLLSFLCCLAFIANAQNDSLERVMPGRRNSPEQMKKPYVIIISADGFRYDYAEKYHADNLLKLAEGGVRAASMIPSFPSVTHPKSFNNQNVIGAHGYNPYQVKDMHATFFAWGPAFKQHLQIPAFQNVEVYDLMAEILGIKPLPNDGSGTLAKKILK